jgi:hypothetical protein
MTAECPQRLDDNLMANGSLLFIKLPVTGIWCRTADRPELPVVYDGGYGRSQP